MWGAIGGRCSELHVSLSENHAEVLWRVLMVSSLNTAGSFLITVYSLLRMFKHEL